MGKWRGRNDYNEDMKRTVLGFYAELDPAIRSAGAKCSILTEKNHLGNQHLRWIKRDCLRNAEGGAI